MHKNLKKMSSLTVIVEDEFVEVSTAGLLAHEAMHHLRPEFLQGNGVREGFAAGLQGERFAHVTY